MPTSRHALRHARIRGADSIEAAVARTGRRAAAVLVLLAFVSACAAVTPTNAALEAARSDYRSAESTEEVFLFAGPELEKAGDALNTARKAWIRRAGKAEVNYFAAIVVRHLVLARSVAAAKVAELRKLEEMPDNLR